MKHRGFTHIEKFMASVFGSMFILFFLHYSLPAQYFPRKDFNPERLSDEIFPMQDLDINYQELYENLLQLLSHPLDLNRTTAEELRSLFILREQQVQALLAYREQNGSFLSVYELQSVPSLDLPTLYKLMPFVTVRDQQSVIDKNIPRRVLREGDNYLILRSERTLERQKGYLKNTDTTGHYEGSPDRLYVRMNSSRPGDFSFGMTAEKDAGEPLMWNKAKRYYGMDFYSFHGQLLNKGRLKNIIVGDYLAQFGQGLALGGGFGMGLGSETITTLRRSTLGFIPYTSLNESGFFRGVASSLNVRKNLTLHTFVSRFRRDAVLNQDTIYDNYSFASSLAVTGYHRTPSELDSRKQILESNYGMVADYHTGSSEAGLILHSTHFNTPVQRNPTPYNQFTFRGDQNTNLSTFLNYTWNNFTFFSEAAQTLQHGSALVAGVLGSLTRKLDLSILYRKFAKDFYSFYSNAISENTIPQNESGIYWGWKYIFSRKYSLSGYVDIFQFPWLRYRGYAPSAGSEWLWRFNFHPSKSTTFFIQVREESKIRNLTGETNLYLTGQGVKRNYWFNCDYAASLTLSFKTRVQMSTYTLGGKTTQGLAFAHDVNFDLGRFSFSTRYALFQTQDYDNRLYLYERDVWLAFSFPAYYGTGIQTYILTQFKMNKKIDLWVRWSHTRYTDRNVLGTAGETIYGNVRNDVKLQARIKLTPP